MKPTLHQCQNCHCSLEEKSNYCDNCGQKRIDHLPSMRELLGDLFSNIWALDSKLLKTMTSLLFQPGQLTLAYLQGNRKGYYTPFKLFIFWLTVSFLLVSVVLEQYPQFHKLDSYNFELKAYQAITQKHLKAHFQDSTDQVVIDSVLAQGLPDNRGYGDTAVTIVGFDFTMEELRNNSVEELIDQQGVDNFLKRQLLIQLLKTYKDPRKFQTYIISHLSWLLLLSLPFLAFWMKILYWRKHPYYIQHLVFLLHWHTFALALLAGATLWMWMGTTATDTWIPLGKFIGIASILYAILALKKVYQQGKLKTLTKFILLLLGYIFLSIFVIALFLLVNFLLF